MNKMCAIIIVACVGATAFFIAAHTTSNTRNTRKRKTHNKAMTFRELLRDNKCCGTTNIWCETGGTK